MVSFRSAATLAAYKNERRRIKRRRSLIFESQKALIALFMI
jgi:hypothetical protein